jgi:hypothetical protein
MLDLHSHRVQLLLAALTTSLLSASLVTAYRDGIARSEGKSSALMCNTPFILTPRSTTPVHRPPLVKTDVQAPHIQG